MNANELAKLLEVDSWYKLVTREEIATMLRQQQAEIEALKAAKIRAYNNGVEDGRKPNTNLVKEQDESFDRTASHMAGEYVSYKAELTDEEIIKVYEDMLGVASAKGSAIDFARAILKKAREK